MTQKLKPLEIIKNCDTGDKIIAPPLSFPVVYTIDWDKVTTVDDIKIILKELNLTINIDRATEHIKPFIKKVI